MDRAAEDVIVIGGGFAGLSAATALAERGVHVAVLEARPSPGGRATAFTDPGTGERVDNGQHVLIGAYAETFRFLRRIGAEQRVYLQPRLTIDVIEQDGRPSRLRCPRLPAPWHLIAGLASWPALGWPERRAALRIVRALREDVRTDDTVRQWLQSAGQTDRLVRLLWEPLAVAVLNQSIDAAAAAPFRAVLRRMFGSRRRDSALGLPRVAMDELYVRPSQAFLDRRGAVVRLNAAARVATSPALSVAVRGETQAARAVICAVPWYSLGDLFPERPPPLADVLAAAAATPAAPIVTVNLWFDRPVSRSVFVGLPGRTMQWVFDKRQLFGDAASHLSLVSSAATAIVDRPNPELIDLALDEVRAALPGARAATLRRAVVVREKRATFSVAPGLPRRPPTRTAIPGLFLAGDWIDTGLPATIEGAVVSGHRAAAAALDYLSR